MQYGYARVSTLSQSTKEQRQQLLEHGVKQQHIYSEKFTGTKNDRPAFNDLLRVLLQRSFKGRTSPIFSLFFYAAWNNSSTLSHKKWSERFSSLRLCLFMACNTSIPWRVALPVRMVCNPQDLGSRFLINR